MLVVTHPEADEELEAAALWHEERQPGLGDDFLDQFETTSRRILAEPTRRAKIQEENRKLNFYTFPFAVIYSVHADTLYVKAVRHLHRRPFYWAHRRPAD